ncbi:MAG: hypothetical protein AABZ47_05990 [Planctomycetota bacterium]
MNSTHGFLAMRVVQAAIVVFPVQFSLVSGVEPTVNSTVKLPLSPEFVTEPRIRGIGKPIRWKGQEYDVASGIDVLMNVIRDLEKGKDRELAFVTLSMSARDLEGRPCLDELARLYDDEIDLQKQAILICFQGSADPRGLPVFIRTLEDSRDLKLRLWAAQGLAHWNIRRGVAEIVAMLESDELMPQPSRMYYARDNAVESFTKANTRKGWGFPDGELRKSIAGKTDLDDQQKAALFITEVKKWFSENEHRFPDWKLGDALPEITPPEQEARP